MKYSPAEVTFGAGIYSISGPTAVYIGKTACFRKRLAVHVFRLILGTHACSGLQKDWDTFLPEMFYFRVLEEARIEALPILERHWIGRHADKTLYNKRLHPAGRRRL